MGSSYSKPKEIPSKYFPRYFAQLPPMALEGKVVAVTGSTTGTGFICAKACAQLGATVVLLNRPSQRAEAAEKAIKEAVPGAKVVSVSCDLMSFEKVKEAAAKLKADFSSTGIDVLVLNAGVMALKDEATVDGCDVQMQTNHLSHFLLTGLVWPLLEKAVADRGEARVVNHSSIARKGPALEAKYLGKNGGNLGGDSGGCMPFKGPRWTRYQQTKLANVVFTYALHDRIQQAGSKVKVLVAHPGVAATNLQVSSVTDGAMGGSLANIVVSQSAEDGALGIFKCSVDPSVKSGEFYGPSGMGMAGDAVLLPNEPLASPESRALLWEQSEQSTGFKFTL